MKTISTPTLDIAYHESGPAHGGPVILLHGWPSDPQDYDGVAPALATNGCRVLAPYLRGFGPTRFRDPATMRTGQQAALAADLRDFMDALAIERATLAGYDRGGRAACIAAALWPERVRGLVSITGYNIQHIDAAATPAPPDQEQRFWYQWYFQTERGRAGLEQNRRALARLLWHLWSPNWQFDSASFAATAQSFDNEDFVALTIHSYRHRYAGAEGDPTLEPLERRLAAQPPITVPAIALHGEADGVTPAALSAHHARHFTGPYERRLVPKAGHFLPREAPETVARAVQDLL